MAHSLRTLTDVKGDEKIARKVDGFRIKLSSIRIIEGFNERVDRDELREHIASIAGALSAGQRVQDLEVWINPEDGVPELVDGHCTYNGYLQYAETATDFDGWVSAREFKGTQAQRKARIVTSNNQLKLLPIEMGRVYLSLRDEHGMSRQEIAAEVGRSLAHVDQMILLAGAKSEVIAAVEAGEISATEAVKLARDHGDDAPAELERRKEAAGGGKVTAKVAPVKKAAEKKVGRPEFVVSAATALVESIGQSEEGCMMVWVRFDLLEDLKTSVLELKESAKPLDADKQTEMEI